MGAGTAKAHNIEAVYRLVWIAISSRRPIHAIYHSRRRLLCPHRLGRNAEGYLQVLCYQYGGDSGSGLNRAGSPGNWRCLALEKLSRVELLDEKVWRTAPNHSRPQTCVRDADIDAEDEPNAS